MRLKNKYFILLLLLQFTICVSQNKPSTVQPQKKPTEKSTTFFRGKILLAEINDTVHTDYYISLKSYLAITVYRGAKYFNIYIPTHVIDVPYAD